MRKVLTVVVCLSAIAAASAVADGPGPEIPFLATGVRVGEVTPRTAIVWVRLTRAAERNWTGKTANGASNELPADWRVEELQGACPGVTGSVRVVYRAAPSPVGGALPSVPLPVAHAARATVVTPWREVSSESDFTTRFRLDTLAPGTRYDFRVETSAETGAPGASWSGSFQTAPESEAVEDVTFTVVTGMMYRNLDDDRGYRIYAAMATLDPSFLVATGDTVYYDGEWPMARGTALARFHWHRMYSLPRIAEFHRHVSGYWLKDDHDAFNNDCWPGNPSGRVAPLTFAEGQAIFREQVPMGDKTYRTVRWGKHLQLWFVEGRDFRSPNTLVDGPTKTIWGDRQKRWLKKSLLESLKSDVTFRVLVSATPIVGPDQPTKSDNHANEAFSHEGNGFRQWVREHFPDRFYVVCGDRHWQYHSVDPVTSVQEFSCGPASDRHAGGSPGFDSEYHRFHREKGGFLSVRAGEAAGRPFIRFRFHDVDGRVVYDYRETRAEPELLDVPLGKASSRRQSESPIYDTLLEEARATLADRARLVAALTDPAAIVARQRSVGAAIRASFNGFPERTPLNARVVGRVERDDHVMEKVIYESLPGFHVTANMYLPKQGAPPYPAILFPCGHSVTGKAGGPYQSAGQEFARRGFAVLVFDPIGQGERFQFLDSDDRPIVGGTTEHLLTGTAALLVGSNTAEVMIWDGIRSIDYLASRNDIDLDRLGATGNSGGGTQTSYLMVLDPRLRAAAPACYLTNFTHLLETIGPQDAEQNFRGFIAGGFDQADFVLAFAPKPALVCAATGDFFAVGGTWATYREAKRIYGRLGAAEAVDLIEIDAKHGYHPRIRQRVGRFFESALLGKKPAEIVPTVREGTLYADSELWCTETGQVVSAFDGRTVADLWREREAELRPRREQLFRDLDRPAWLRGVRRLATMAETIAVPLAQDRGRSIANGVSIEKLGWDEPFPVTAVRLSPRLRKDNDKTVTLVVASSPEKLATRLLARARAGETIVLVSLPGYGDTAHKKIARPRWGKDWQDALLAFHLDRTTAGIRADALRQAIVLTEERSGGGQVNVEAEGMACVPALLAAVMEPAVARIRLDGGLDSWASVVADGLHNDRLGNVVPGALAHFDLPLLREAMAPRPVEHVAPTDPHGWQILRWRF